MSIPAACLLLSQSVPAIARLYAEYRRLQGSTPPADDFTFAGCVVGVEKETLRHADMAAAVRLCAFLASRAPRSLQRHNTCTPPQRCEGPVA